MRIIFLHTLLLSSIFCMGQPKQELSEELERRHGFKDIRMASPVDSVPGIELKKEFMEGNEFEASLYSIKKPFLGSVGEIKIRSIELKTYKGLIYEIKVETDKDPRLMEGLEKAYGKSTYNLRTHGYHWRSNSLKLTAFGEKNSNRLEYVSYTIHKMMKADKGKKVDDIADDF